MLMLRKNRTGRMPVVMKQQETVSDQQMPSEKCENDKMRDDEHDSFEQVEQLRECMLAVAQPHFADRQRANDPHLPGNTERDCIHGRSLSSNPP